MHIFNLILSVTQSYEKEIKNWNESDVFVSSLAGFGWLWSRRLHFVPRSVASQSIDQLITRICCEIHRIVESITWHKFEPLRQFSKLFEPNAMCHVHCPDQCTVRYSAPWNIGMKDPSFLQCFYFDLCLSNNVAGKHRFGSLGFKVYATESSLFCAWSEFFVAQLCGLDDMRHIRMGQHQTLVYPHRHFLMEIGFVMWSSSYWNIVV